MQVSEGSARSVCVYTLNEPNHSKSVNSECRHRICISIYMFIYTKPYDVLLESNSNELKLVFLFAYTPSHTHTHIHLHTHYRTAFFVFIFKCNVHKQTRTRRVCVIYSRRNFQRFVSSASTTNTDVCFHGVSLCVANNTSVASRKKKNNKNKNKPQYA